LANSRARLVVARSSYAFEPMRQVGSLIGQQVDAATAMVLGKTTDCLREIKRKPEKEIASMAHRGWLLKNVWLAIAVTAVTLVSAGGMAHAQCSSGGNSCTLDGTGALAGSTGSNESAFGFFALGNGSDTGVANTAVGIAALGGNSSGIANTATGAYAIAGGGPGLGNTGNDNTATGYSSLEYNTIGFENTATGASALIINSSGYGNTATGANALLNNTTGYLNTATGYYALANSIVGSAITGNYDTATGAYALQSNVSGSDNTATGYYALYANNTGGNNTAIGWESLLSASGGNNIGVGSNAGSSLISGSNNIDIGNQGLKTDSNTIRIGTQGTQTATFVAGVNSARVFFGTPVLINSSGQLGTLVSSARYKRDIRDMGDASSNLMKLRPVSFRYKEDPDRHLQYGLIAEDVERVYPELVTHGDDGKVEGVRYELLPALLLNEVQKQAKENQRQAEQIRILTEQAERKDGQIASQQKQIDALKKKDAQIDALAERMNALERQARLAKPEHLASAMR
jgi:hypothetical protein